MRPWILSLVVLGAGCQQETQDTGTAPGVPDIDAPAQPVDFGAFEDLGFEQATVTILNVGDADLHVTNVDVLPPFRVPITELTIGAQSSAGLAVYFEPTAYEAVEGSMFISSDDPDEDLVEVVLRAEVLADVDGDGYLRPEAGGDDCDDRDPDVHPGAVEQYYDGIDADCLGDNDYDQDGDGYEADAINPDPGLGGGDCNDLVDWIHPGAPDDFYDGVDADCGGEDDWDADGDGYASLAYGQGRDCDDADPLAYPGADERLNGKLDDCDGEVDRNIRSIAADVQVLPSRAPQGLGSSLAWGDVDGDGVADLLVGADQDNSALGGAYGSAVAFLSTAGLPADGWTTADAAASVVGLAAGDELGSAVAWFADFSGDGAPDVAVGASGAAGGTGEIYVFSASDIAAGTATPDTAPTRVVSTSGRGYRVGRAIAVDADLDGDGVDDLLFEASQTSSDSGKSELLLLYGGATGQFELADVDARWLHGSNEAANWRTLSAPADIDGDGLDDFVFADPDNSDQGSGSGGAWILWGSTTRYAADGEAFKEDAPQVLTADPGLGLGEISGVIRDVDGDGRAEVATVLWTTRQVLVFGGDVLSDGGLHGPPDALFDAALPATAARTRQVRSIGDWDGDGLEEWALSIEGDAASNPGDVYIFTAAATWGSGEADVLATSILESDIDDANAHFGDFIAPRPGDLDGDGAPDLLLTDPDWYGDLDGDGVDDVGGGSVYAFLNGGL